MKRRVVEVVSEMSLTGCRLAVVGVDDLVAWHAPLYIGHVDALAAGRRGREMRTAHASCRHLVGHTVSPHFTGGLALPARLTSLVDDLNGQVGGAMQRVCHGRPRWGS